MSNELCLKKSFSYRVQDKLVKLKIFVIHAMEFEVIGVSQIETRNFH